MEMETIILLYPVLLLGALAMLAMYTSHRQRRFAPTRSEDSIYRCVECDAVYTDDADVDLSRCPQCGKMNAPIRF